MDVRIAMGKQLPDLRSVLGRERDHLTQMHQIHEAIVTHQEWKGYLESLKPILISSLNVYIFVNLRLVYE